VSEETKNHALDVQYSKRRTTFFVTVTAQSHTFKSKWKCSVCAVQSNI